MMTKIAKILVLAFALLPLTAFSAGEVDFFSATFNGSVVRLDWKLSLRQQANFEVWRKRPDETSYTKLADLDYNGTEVYTFEDENLFKGQGGQQVAFSYKLVVHQTSQVQNYLATVENGPTAVQRSWGSIKMMFR
jgi:hypothetical protein